MKKYFLFLLLLSTISAKAQEDTKALTLFKMQPFSLLTNNLEVGIERFNAKQTRSWELNIGIRYAYKEDNGSNFGSSFAQETFFDKWFGLNATIQRKIYAPSFKPRNKNLQNSTGVYFSPYLRGDYSKNTLHDIKYIGYIDSGTSQGKSITQQRDGSINYTSLTPGINLGFQFTLWQNLYIDAFLGGGLRILSKKEQIDIKILPQNQYIGSTYSIQHNTIQTFQNRQGILPNIGISMGVKW